MRNKTVPFIYLTIILSIQVPGSGLVWAGIDVNTICTVPFFSQQDPRWADKPLDHSPVTIGTHGCALTATAMVVSYYGVETDPNKLNDALTVIGGIDNTGILYWDKVPDVCGGKVTWIERVDTPDWDRINFELDQRYRVIAEVNALGIPQHFIVFWGNDGSNYYFYDPADLTETDRIWPTGYHGNYSLIGLRIYHGSLSPSLGWWEEGAPRTTHQYWTFSSGHVGQIGNEWGAIPEEVDNPVPLGVLAMIGAETYVNWYGDEDNGHFQGEDLHVYIKLDNYEDGAYKIMWFDVGASAAPTNISYVAHDGSVYDFDYYLLTPDPCSPAEFGLKIVPNPAWEEIHFTIPGQDATLDYIHVDTICTDEPLVPFFSQRNPNWQDDPIIDRDGNYCGTIGKEGANPIGCAMTCTAMLLKYYGIGTDPGRLNAWLNSNRGYEIDGLLNWYKVEEYSHRKMQYIDSLKWTSQPPYTDNDHWNELHSQVIQGYPVIVEVDANLTTPQLEFHWVLVTAFTGGDINDPNNYYINDPWDINFVPNKRISHFHDETYDNTFFAIRVYHWNPSAVLITSYCPIDLIVTDPNGLIVSKELNEIPEATYSEYDVNGDDKLDDRVMIPCRKVGNYHIDVVQEPNALPTDTYSLETTIEGQTMVMADKVPIQDIPAEPYIVESKLCYSDFDSDGNVNFADLAKLALHWLDQDCNYPIWCEGTDLNYNHFVDFADYVLFAEHWLEGATP